MIFTQHPTNNMELRPPDNWDHNTTPCDTLHVTLTKDAAGLNMMCSFWRPDAEELAALNAGYPIVMMVYSQSHPVVAMGVEHAGIEFPEAES